MKIFLRSTIMGIVVNLSLIILGTIAFVLGISYFIREKNHTSLRVLILMLGIFATMWCFGYAFMGMTGNTSFAIIGRNFGLFGVIAFMVTETAFLIIEVGLPKLVLKTLLPVTVLIAAIDFVFYSNINNLIFIRYQERTCYYARSTPARSFHEFFIIFLFVSMLSIGIYWLRKVRLRREKDIVFLLIVANLSIAVASLPDTILPLLNLPSFPASCYGCFIAFFTVWFVCNKFNAFSISVQNFSSYIYKNVDAVILLFDPYNKLSVANEPAHRFLSFDRVNGQSISELFEISSADADTLFQTAKEEAESSHSFRLVARNNGAICSLTLNQIKDKYGETYGTICFVYDLSREEAMLREVSEMKEKLQEELSEKTRQVERLTLQAISTIANTIDAKDTYTKGHSIRVAEYSAQLAEALGYSEDVVQNIKYIALLHDIGKIGVPDNVLNKPGKLTDLEFELIKSHTTIGGEILKDITLIPDVAIGAKYHHERYNGKGYPTGLKGTDIPDIARIICIADSYDAMNSKRVYRNSLSREVIREELIKGKGTQFDPTFVTKFIELFDAGLLLDNPSDATASETIMDESSRLLEHIIENIENEKQKSSERDSLTGLYNRSAGEPLIATAMALAPGCLAFIDLDNLKPINDQFGHLAGDHALVTVADVLRKNNHNAIIVRIGGDEFLYYMKNVTEKDAQATIEGILHSFRSKKENDPILAKASLSIGLCLSTVSDTYNDIYKKADKALYYVKQNGKDGFYFYHRSVETTSRMNAVDLRRLVDAIAKQGNYEGSLGVEYRTFAKIYDFINNLVDRYQHSLKLIMITLEPSADATLTLEHHEEAMSAMERAIKSSLRNVDVNTRFSSEQFLVILINAESASVQMIVTRIFNQFYKNYTHNNIVASYDVADIKGEE